MRISQHVFAGLLLVLSSLGQRPAKAPQSDPATPTIKVDTKLTIVDVTVTDKYGHPVHGLKPEDFTIKEDGKPQPIKNFDEYGTTVPTAASAQPALPRLPPGLYTNQPTATPTTSASNILLFDDINTGLNLLAKPDLFLYAQNQAANYLKTLPPGTRVAIMVAGDRLRLVQDFTTDKDVLTAAIRRMRYLPASGTVLTFPVGGSIDGHINVGPQICIAANRRSHLTMDSLRQLSAFVTGIQGRKNVVWFSPGIPWLTNYDFFSGARCLDNLTPQLHETYGVLTAARAALYTADSSGLQSSTDMDISGAPTYVEAGKEWGIEEFEQRALLRESLQDFADATGGKAFYGRNDLDAATAEAISSGSDYYAVAYTPPLSGYDGKYHSINVKVNRPGLQLTYRKGYTSLDLAKLNSAIDAGKDSAANRAKAAAGPLAALSPAVSLFRSQMAHGALPSTELLMAARITPAATPAKPAPPPVKGDLNPTLKPKVLVRYDIIYSIVAGQITLAEGPDGKHSGSIEFDIAAYAEDGTKLNVLHQRANITLAPGKLADFQKNPFDVPLQLDLPPGKLFVRVGALDTLSGKAGTLEAPITVAKP